MGSGTDGQAADEKMEDEATRPQQPCITDPWPCIFVLEWFNLSQFGAVYLYTSMIFLIPARLRLTTIRYLLDYRLMPLHYALVFG